MKIAIFGAGAIGIMFAGRLHHVGHEVTIVGRGATLAKIQAEGIVLEGANEKGAIPSIPSTSSPSEVGEVDLVILCVKAWQVHEAAKAIAPMVGDKTLILTCQNGVDAPGEVAAVHGKRRVVAGIARVIARKTDLNVVQMADFPPSIFFRSLNPEGDGSSSSLSQALEDAGFDMQLQPDINKALWEKFAFISVFGGAGAFYRQGMGHIRSHPERRQLLEEMLAEIREVGLAHGINLGGNLIADTMALFDFVPEDAMSSTCRNLLAGEPSELDSQNGAVLRLAAEKNIAVPINQRIYEVLWPMEQAARAAQH